MTTLPVDVASSKVRILDAPTQLPGVCMLCGSSRNDDRKYVDIGKDIEFVGVIYFCTFCFTEIANRLGCLTQEQSAALEAELEAARARILEFHSKDEALNAAINTLRSTGLFSDDNPIAAISIGGMVDSKNPESGQFDFSNSEQLLDQLNPKTEQSNSEQRPTDVSTARNDESFGFGSL